MRQEAVVVTFLVRHGQTESNLATRYAGRSPEPLTATGRMQIEALARRLGSCGIAEIWSSEVVRARESADIIGGALGLPVQVDARLNEIAMGPWEGLSEGEVAEQFPAAYALWQIRPDCVRIGGRETLEQVAARVMASIVEAAQRPCSVLLVTHVAPMRVAILRVLGLPLSGYKGVAVGNGDCVSVDWASAEVHRLGESRSMRAELRTA